MEKSTLKQKASELVDKMNGYTFEDCKNNAITCVDEILKIYHRPSDEFKYWQEVRLEISKL